MNKRGAMMEVIIVLIVAVVIALIVIVFNQNSIGGIGAALNANDAVVLTAAEGCSPDLSFGPVDLSKKFCYDFKTVKKKSFLGFSTQEVNCEYLNNTIKASIPKVDYYSTTTCPSTVWAERCQILLNENSEDASYEMVINGKLCDKKKLDAWNAALAADAAKYWTFSYIVYDKSKACVAVAAGTPALKTIVGPNDDGKNGQLSAGESNVYFKTEAECLAAPALKYF